MSKKLKSLIKDRHLGSYSFNKATIPFPAPVLDKAKPPQAGQDMMCDSNPCKPKLELSMEEQAQQYMDNYRKAERVIVINFYTGGGAYKRGVLDAIYRGFNPMNPGA